MDMMQAFEKKRLSGRLAAGLLAVALLAAPLPTALLLAAPAWAQNADGDLVPSTNSLGNLLGHLNGADPGGLNLEDACGKQVGCIIIANNSDDYDLVEVDLDVKTRIERGPRWMNILEESRRIAPRKIFMIPRIGDDKLAVVGLRAVLKNPKTHDRRTIDIGTIDLRPDPEKRLFINFLRFDPSGALVASPAPGSTEAAAPPQKPVN